METIRIKKAKVNLNNIIIVPTDFSEVCENAVRHTLQIAKYIDFKVALLHVINKDTLNYLQKNNLSKSTLEDKLKEHIEKYKIEFGIDVTYVLKEGELFKQVQKTVTELGANMVVLGTHGKVGFQKITGSYAVKVINKTHVPTIVVQKKPLTEPYRNVVFPVTFSTQDRQKVNWAIYIAKTFRSTIHIFPKRENEAFKKKKIMSVVKQIKVIFDKHNVKYVDQVSEEGAGNFSKQLLDYAVANEADLIMTMITKHKFLPFLSSMDEQIIFNSSQIPVICINPTDVKKVSWY
jgi:nucleotide-binding universal stress UspA family protein